MFFIMLGFTFFSASMSVGAKLGNGLDLTGFVLSVLFGGIILAVYTGTLGSLKRYKDDVKEVSAGMDCGLNIDNFNDIKVGDIIEGYTEKEVARKL